MTDQPTPPTAKPASKSAQSSGQKNPKKNQFDARLNNLIEQLKRHGYSAEVVVRTTPEATDIINFARLWEYVIVQADRATRGYRAHHARAEFDATRADFIACIDFMVERLKATTARHQLDLSGSNFIDRIAQRYGVATRRAGAAAPATDIAAVNARPPLPNGQPQPHNNDSDEDTL